MTVTLQGNWEPPSILGWTRAPEERTCSLCRRDVLHTKAEHDLLYPVDRKERLERERAEEQAQAAKDAAYITKLIKGGMTEEQAADAWWRAMYRGEI